MFKDDRFISILSGVVLMIAIGTVVQRGGPLVEYFKGDDQAPVLVRDRVSIPPAQLSQIDVLENDLNVSRADRGRLAIVTAPACGVAFVQDTTLNYVPGSDCAGEITIVYGIGQSGITGEVRVFVEEPAGKAETGTAEAGASETGASGTGVSGTGVSETGTAENGETAGTPADLAEARTAPASTAPAQPTSEPLRTERPVAESPAAAEPPAGPADPRRIAVPHMPSAPRVPESEDAPTLALVTPPTQPAPQRATAAPSSLAPALPGSEALAAVEVSQPAAQPARAAIRPPAELNTGAWDARNNDFVTASSRGGLLSRPVRASTGAVPDPSVIESAIVAAQESETPPTIGGPAIGWQPGTLALATPDATALEVPTDGLQATPRSTEPPSLGATGETEDGDQIASLVREPDEPGAFTPGVLRTALPGSDRGRISTLSDAPSPDSASPLSAPGSLPTIGLARVDRRVSAYESPSAPTVGAGPAALAGGSALDASVARPVPSSIGGDLPGSLAFAPPSDGLGEVRELGRALNIVPVERTSAPGGLVAPSADDSAIGIRRPTTILDFDPDAPAVEMPQDAAERRRLLGSAGEETDAATETDAAAETDLAADADAEGDMPGPVAIRSPASAACVEPPSHRSIPRPGPGAVNDVLVLAPCFPGEILRLTYHGLTMAKQADASGQVEFAVLGFEPRTPATVIFPDGSDLNLDLRFQGTERIHRVAMVWDDPVTLGLHALPLRAEEGSAGHIRPDNQGSLAEARRGGGYLSKIEPAGGGGDRAWIFTYFPPRSGQHDVVRLRVDYPTRTVARAPETCGDGAYSSPAFRIIRSDRGQMSAAVDRRLTAIDCSEIAQSDNGLIDAQVEAVVSKKR